MGGILAFIVLVLWFGARALRAALGYKVEPFRGTSRSRVIRTAARYAASAGRRRR